MNMKLPNTFSIFPVQGKKPLVDWGEYSKRLPSQQELEEWKKKYTQWGIATGPISKILVLDDDGGFSKLDPKGYSLPRTLTQKTPRGGTHYFFKWTKELENKVTTKVGILEGVDVRGLGGFACFYGFTKPYWLVPMALPPKWLIDILPNKVETMSSKVSNKLDNIREGNRNDSFTRLAGGLRARGYKPEEIFKFLEAKAREVGFSENELMLICNSVGRYEPKVTSEEQASSIDEFLKDQEKVEWICPGLIAKKSIGFIAGLPESRKTWLIIDLAVECAKGGGKWLDKFDVTQAKVLFIDQERFRGETQRRFKAVIKGKNLSKGILNHALFVRSGTTTRLNIQHSYDAFRKELADIRPDLVLIDSLASFHTSEENNRKDIQAVLERVKELRNEFGCTFLFIHHENKMAFNKEEAGDPSISQMAGSVAIPAAAEMVMTVRKQDSESSMVYNTKNTLSQSIAPFLVKVIDIDENKIEVKAY